MMLGLRKLRDVEFISIQKGYGSEQLRLNQGLNFLELKNLSTNQWIS